MAQRMQNEMYGGGGGGGAGNAGGFSGAGMMDNPNVRRADEH